jgi:hypothetical protein
MATAIMTLPAPAAGITLGAASAVADQNAEENGLLPTTPDVNFLSYPLAGGPYLVDATHDALSKRTVLVFNERIDRATLRTAPADGSNEFATTDSAVASIDWTAGTFLYLGGRGVGFENLAYTNGIGLTDNTPNWISAKPRSANCGLASATGWNTDGDWRLIGSGPNPPLARLPDTRYKRDGTTATFDAQQVIIARSVVTTLQAANPNAAVLLRHHGEPRHG